MGFSGISPWSLILILLIVILLFGTKKLKHLGSDLGELLKGVKKGFDTKEAPPSHQKPLNKKTGIDPSSKTK